MERYLPLLHIQLQVDLHYITDEMDVIIAVLMVLRKSNGEVFWEELLERGTVRHNVVL